MDILEKIAASKREEVQEKKKILPIDFLEQLPHYNRKCYSLKARLEKDEAGVIAEFKRRSPSLPELNLIAEVEEVTKGYETAGASGISVLTDEIYFGGSLDDLVLAREIIAIPILRKDFIIDPYQIHEAKAFGADVILLIAALLSREQIASYSQTAKSLGMEVLLEVHNAEELQKSLMPGIGMVGVNNRNLKTFEVSLETSKQLSALIPDEFVKVSESGISNVAAIKELQKIGYRGFLIGENFMKTADPVKAATKFIENLKS